MVAARSGRCAATIGGGSTQVRLGRTRFDSTSSALVLGGIAAMVGGLSATTLLVILFVESSRRRRPIP